MIPNDSIFRSYACKYALDCVIGSENKETASDSSSDHSYKDSDKRFIDGDGYFNSPISTHQIGFEMIIPFSYNLNDKNDYAATNLMSFTTLSQLNQAFKSSGVEKQTEGGLSRIRDFLDILP